MELINKSCRHCKRYFRVSENSKQIFCSRICDSVYYSKTPGQEERWKERQKELRRENLGPIPTHSWSVSQKNKWSALSRKDRKMRDEKRIRDQEQN